MTDQSEAELDIDVAKDGEGEQSEAPRPDWAVVITVGPQSVEAETGSRVVDISTDAPHAADVVARLLAENISPADLRARVLLSVTDEPNWLERVLVAYSVLCGFAGRRLDVRVGEESLELAEFDRMLRNVPDAGRPAQLLLQAQVGGQRDDMPVVDLTAGFTPEALSTVRFASRLRFVAPPTTSLALSQLVAIAAVRSRAGLDRFPMLVSGDEPLELPVGEDGNLGTIGLCLHEARRMAEQQRREARGDVRDAVADFVEPSPRQKHLIKAAEVPVETVLAALGVRSSLIEVSSRGADPAETVEVLAYHCPLPSNHTNGDATPSARIVDTHDGGQGFRCHRCLREPVDSLRLVMWARSYSPDEAADWILAQRPAEPAAL